MLESAVAAPNLDAFYGAFSPVCFTLLGLWLIVVQTRHGEWRHSAIHRSRAYALSLCFALPGMMALLSLVAPGNSTLWRAAFAIVAFAGAIILMSIALRGRTQGNHSSVSLLTTAFAILIYVVIGLLAVAPHLVTDVGIRLHPLECEAILLSTLVFVAVNVAWLLMFDEVEAKEQAG